MTSTHPPTNYRPMIIIAFAVAFAINGATAGWIYWLAAQRPTVSLSQPVIDSDAAICPFDTLDYSFTVSVSKPASVDLYTSVDRAEPNNHISYTRLQQFKFDAPTDLEIVRHWILPPTYREAVSGAQVVWQPGDYIQRTSANILGRSDVSMIEVPFSVREDCTQ